MYRLNPFKALTLSFLLLLSSRIVARSSCVTDCIARSPDDSACTGKETGQGLSDCICATFDGYNDPLLVCVRACPSSDIAAFATSIPAQCRSTLLPGVTATTTATMSALSATATGGALMTKSPVELSVAVAVTAMIKAYAL